MRKRRITLALGLSLTAAARQHALCHPTERRQLCAGPTRDWRRAALAGLAAAQLPFYACGDDGGHCGGVVQACRNGLRVCLSRAGLRYETTGHDTFENAGLSDGSEAAIRRAWPVRPSVCPSLAAARPPAWGCLEAVRQRSTRVSGLVWTAGEGLLGAPRRWETCADAGQRALVERCVCAKGASRSLWAFR